MKRMLQFGLLLMLCSTAGAAEAVQSRIEGAAILAFSGKHEEARPQVERALAEYRAEGDRVGEGVSLILMGIIDTAAHKTTEARVSLEKAAEILRAKGDFITSFIALWALAELDKSENKIGASLERHVAALKALEDAAAPGAPFSLAGLAILGPAVGMNTDALKVLDGAAGMMKPILLSMFESMMRDSYGGALISAGQLDEAERQLTRARDAGSMFGIFNQSIEAHFGDLYRRKWQFDAAREHYRKALSDIAPMPIIPQRDEWITVRSMNQMAEIEQLRGRIDEAFRWNDQALEIVRKSGNRSREASVLSSRGDLLMAVSRYSDAEKVLTEGMQLAEAIGDTFQHATMASTLGAAHFMHGDFGRAAPALEKAVALYRKTDAAIVEAVTLITLAEVYVALGANDTARAALERARTLGDQNHFPLAGRFAEVVLAIIDIKTGAEPGKQKLNDAMATFWGLPDTGDLLLPRDFRSVLMELFDVGWTPPNSPETPDEKRRLQDLGPMLAMKGFVEGKRLIQQGNAAGARAAWEKALQQNTSRELTGPLLAAVGATYAMEGRADDASTYFERAVAAIGSVAEDVKVDELLAGYLGGERKWFFDMAVQSLARQGKIEAAFDHAERARARAFLLSVANGRLQPGHGGDPVLVNQAEVLRRRIASWQAGGAVTGEAADDLRHARADYQSVLKRVKASNPEYSSLINVEPSRLQEIQRELPPDTTMISYFLGLNTVHAWIVKSDSIAYVVLPAPRSALKKVSCWAKSLDSNGTTRSMGAHDSDCPEQATPEVAYRLLIEPLQSQITSERLIIVPHGELHYVPFGALRNPATNCYLLEEHAITYAPSASALHFLREKETPVDGEALVIGDPALPSGKNRLAGAQREAVAVARALDTEALTGTDAMEGLLYDLEGRYDIVHIAAHAFYDTVTPLFSYVALAPDSRTDGRLEVNDILSVVDLRGVNLVVLSACGTARGERSGGDEIVGLTRAVLYAGAPGVISTLWDVDDVATADLMTDMYRRLRGGDSVADALRKAQLALMQRKPYADPRYWAAFELHGDPQGRWKGRTSVASH